ncbi:MAG: ATP-binding protein, partial [Candidatus Hodarchaeales archaeon]
MTNNDSIEVTSHISRDFLQNAAYFNTMPKLVWEYVANSLDAAKENEPVIVMVDVTSNYVTISDNGIGMSRNDLNNFFKMHGENIRRKIGKRVRGRFGTGKSAAFGLADTLQIDTSQGGLRNVVKLTRQDIEQAENGKPFPVKDIIVNQTTDGEDGTKVEIRDFNIRRPNVDQVVTYIERHLSRYKQRALVSING